MGCQESLDFYLNLSRKVLQGLCKTHNLPANRSHVQLAKSLASFLKKRNANSTSLKDRSSSPVESSFNKPSLPESQPKARETAYHPEEAKRGAFERRTNSSECDSYKLASSINEMMDADRPHCQTGNQAYNAVERVVCPYPVNSGATEGFCCSTSEPELGGIRPLVAAAVQENSRNTQVHIECHNAITRKETHKPSLPNIYSHKVPHNAAARGPSSFTLVPYRQQTVAECSTKSKLVSSDEISTKAAPSFQFFVTSEEGINLYVDLNSNPSEWINSFKDDIIICKKAQHNLRVISHHTRGLADVDEPRTISSSGTRVDLQSDGVEKNTECISSSLSSFVSENCHSEANVPDRTAVTSGSSVLTSMDAPVEISGFFEGNQVISSSSITCSIVQDQLTCDVVSYPGNGKGLPQDSLDASFRMETSNASVLEASMKPIGNFDVLSPDGTRNHDPMDNHYLKIASFDSINVEATVLSNTPVSFSEEQGLTMPDGSRNKMKISDIGNFAEDSRACHARVENGLPKGLLGVSGQQNRSLNSSQLDGQLLSDCPTTDVQSDMRSANHQQIQHACGGPGNTVTEDSVSAFNNELGGGIAVKENESSECLKSQNSLGKGSKRSHSLESPDEFLCKSQHANTESKRGKTLAKETIPRRSTRLIK